MPFLDQGGHGGLQPGGSDSSGDATPTPKTPTNEFFPRHGRLTPSPHYSRPRSIVVSNNDGGAMRQDLRHIWEDSNRQAPQTASRAHVVFPESPNSFDYDTASTRRGAVALPLPARAGTAQVDANEWEIGLERLRLTESITQQAQTSSDISNRLQGSFYPYDARSNASTYAAQSGTASAAQPAAQPATQPRTTSIWSTYGTQTSPSNSLRNDGIAFTPQPYLSHSAPRPARADPAPSYRSRASSETSFNGLGSLPQTQPTFNGSEHLPQAQRSFVPHLSSPVPVRMGQSPTSAYPSHNRTASGPDPYQPVPFYLQPRSQGFLPMHAVRAASRESSSSIPVHAPSSTLGLLTTATTTTNPTVLSTRFSDRYHGMHTVTNASAEHLSAEQNASLWITNLPPDVTHRELLARIRHVGRIWCCFINGPDGLKHATAAAKIVFFQPAAAQRLLQRSVAGDSGGLEIRGFRAKVTQNRIKTGATVPRGGDDSRVLIVTGHAHFVNEATLTAYFGQRFVFQVDEVRELVRGGGGGGGVCRAVVEFRFGSYRCQAQMGKISLEKDRPIGFEKAEFGEDPCEVGETYSSHSIALLRIRGIGL